MGTSVRVCPTLTSALCFVAGTLANPWAGGWTIFGPGGERIADFPDTGPVVCPPAHDEEQDAPTQMFPVPLD